MIRVATYNIRKCVGLDWQRRPDRIIAVLAEIGADIVALQEADRRLGDRPATLAAERLAAETGLHLVDLDPDAPSSGWHGNAILVRDHVAVEGVTPIDLPSLEPRGALIADLRAGDLALRVGATHLGLRARNRRAQAEALLAAMQRREAARRAVILGDLNEWKPEGAALGILSAAFTPSPPLPSFHTAAPVAALDRILIGPGLGFRRVAVHRSELARRASDHLPVWAEIDAVAGSE